MLSSKKSVISLFEYKELGFLYLLCEKVSVFFYSTTVLCASSVSNFLIASTSKSSSGFLAFSSMFSIGTESKIVSAICFQPKTN